MDRRKFIAQMGTMSLGAAALPRLLSETSVETILDFGPPEARPAADWARDEDFWASVRLAYTVSPTLVNLNNGGVSPQPLVVQEALDRYTRLANEAPSYYMWRTLEANREPLRQELARLAGCSPEELAIVRNTTEALDIAIMGMDLKAGDEVVLTKQDYPNMVHAWKQREKREGIVLKWANFELPIENERDLVRGFLDQFTERTKVVHITHMINWVGQILPSRKIAEEARKRGVRVLIDGAHSFAQVDYKIPDLGGDYFGTSLHKWLCAPFGTGLLYVKKERIRDLWALTPNHLIGPESDDIRKFEGLGTRSIPHEMAIAHALDFHNAIGTARKEARLRFLKDYWTERAAKMPGVRIHTPIKPEFSCALALFSVDGWKPADVASQLESKHKIHVVAIDWENIHGVRVTPHVYTSKRDLDRLLAGIEDIAGRKPTEEAAK